MVPATIVDHTNLMGSRSSLLMRISLLCRTNIVAIDRLPVVCHTIMDGKQLMVVPLVLVHDIDFNAGCTILGTVVEEHIILYGEHIAQIVLDTALDQRGNPAVAIHKGNTLLPLNGSNFGITTNEIPLGRELTHLLTLHVVLEHDDTASNEVALGGSSLGIVVVLCLVFVSIVVLLGLFAGLAALVALSVENFVHSFVGFFVYLAIHLVLYSVLGSINSTFFQSLQKTLCIGSSSKCYHHQQH